MATMAKVLGLGVKFGGRCVVCGRDTGSRDFERADTLLIKVVSNEKYGVAHPRCAGWRTKTKIGGGRVGGGPDTVAINS